MSSLPFWKTRFFKLGVPFMIFMIGSPFFLKQFTTIRYNYRTGRKLSKEEAESYGLNLVNVEEERQEFYEKIQKEDFDQWENIRGPRPWEDSKTVQKELRQQQNEQPR